MSSTCRSCGATILWATTIAGKAMPLNLEPTIEGNVRRRTDGKVEVLKAQQLLADYGELRYTPHHATCPQGSEWKRKKT